MQTKTKNRPKAKAKPIPAPEVERRIIEDEEYDRRFQKHLDELKWLYTELYSNEWMFDELCKQMYWYYTNRREDLKALDRKREADPNWYKKNDMLGVMLYVDNFAGNLQGVKSKLDYLKESNINYVHLMPLLESPKGRSDGGYAVAGLPQGTAGAGYHGGSGGSGEGLPRPGDERVYGLRNEPHL